MIIYVKLLNEGTDVWRPVEAEKLKDNVYRISMEQNYDSEDEEWEFLPGEIVICEIRKSEKGDILLAKEKGCIN